MKIKMKHNEILNKDFYSGENQKRMTEKFIKKTLP
jgi:hypothetical protein